MVFNVDKLVKITDGGPRTVYVAKDSNPKKITTLSTYIMIYSTNIILSCYQFMYLLVTSYIAVFARREPPHSEVLFS